MHSVIAAAGSAHGCSCGFHVFPAILSQMNSFDCIASVLELLGRRQMGYMCGIIAFLAAVLIWL